MGSQTTKNVSTSKVGIWWTYPRNLCTSMQERHRQEGVLFLARRDFSSPPEIFPPLISLKTQPFWKRIQMHSFRKREATGQEIPRSIRRMCTRPSRVGLIQGRGVSVSWSYFEDSDPERTCFPSRRVEGEA